jgi:hypothetical protein
MLFSCRCSLSHSKSTTSECDYVDWFGSFQQTTIKEATLNIVKTSQGIQTDLDRLAQDLFARLDLLEMMLKDQRQLHSFTSVRYL